MKHGVAITDDLFKDIIAAVSVNHTLYFTPVQLYYSLEQDQRLRSNLSQENPIFGYLCWSTLLVSGSIWIANWLKLDIVLIAPVLLILYALLAIIVVAKSVVSPKVNQKFCRDNVENLKIISIIIFVFGIPLSIVAKTSVGIIGSISLGILAAWLSIKLKQRQPRGLNKFLIDRQDFLKWLNRWSAINYRPGKILASPNISTAQVDLNSKVIAYDFDRVVVCDSPKIAQLLLKNNFHFENNCAVIAIDRYPQDIFAPIKEMLARTPDLKVFAVHDCSPQGLKMIRHLRTEKIWFPDLQIPIISAGMLPRHIMDDPDRMVSQSAESIKSSQQLPADLRNILDPAELAWLDTGYYLELESFPPQELIQILQQGINKSYQLLEIEDGDSIVMISPGFYAVESLI